MSMLETLSGFIGTPVSPLESALLYGTACISFVVLFDSIVGIFRLVARTLQKP